MSFLLDEGGTRSTSTRLHGATSQRAVFNVILVRILRTVKKSSPATRHGGAWGGEEVYLLTSALDGGVSGRRHAPAALYPRGKDPPLPIVQETGWAPELVWTQRIKEKSFVPAGDRTPVVQSVVRHYTAWANPAPILRTVLCWIHGYSPWRPRELSKRQTMERRSYTNNVAEGRKIVKRRFSTSVVHQHRPWRNEVSTCGTMK
jgi:hypothetical protein